MSWEKIELKKIKSIVLESIEENSSYYKDIIMGIPAAHLDKKIFPADFELLKEAPYLRSFLENPNHIGMHTCEESIEIFRGTQKIELDLLRICAEEILKAKKGSYDGYIASGGTECNIQALWTYREYYKKNKKSRKDEIAILSSEDTHYSIHKASNILNIKHLTVKVDYDSRKVKIKDLKRKLEILNAKKVKYLIVVLNMGTTMYGSVDDIDEILNILNKYRFDYKIHIDAAFGGFIYPFTNTNNPYTFSNQSIDSISIDAHKMLQAPYGTGVFMIRKGYAENVLTEEATYIQGMDRTICGSRSGANVIAVWMILNAYGEKGIKEKMKSLIDKTNFLADSLKDMGISFYRNKYMNIIAIKSKDISMDICTKYGLVPDTHNGKPEWWKIVVMDHIKWNIIEEFKEDMTEYSSILFNE